MVVIGNSFLKYLDYCLFFTCARLLNDNKLEGRVPEQIYSVGVHGGAIEYVWLCFHAMIIVSTSIFHKSCKKI